MRRKCRFTSLSLWTNTWLDEGEDGRIGDEVYLRFGKSE